MIRKCFDQNIPSVLVNGNKEHFLLSSMMFYTFIPVYIYWVDMSGPATHLYQVHARHTPGVDSQIKLTTSDVCKYRITLLQGESGAVLNTQ